MESSSEIIHIYNYKDDSDAEYGDEEFYASPQDDNDDEDLRDVEVEI